MAGRATVPPHNPATGTNTTPWSIGHHARNTIVLRVHHATGGGPRLSERSSNLAAVCERFEPRLNMRA
eukprot:1653421-Prymnesium_polylepis.1